MVIVWKQNEAHKAEKAKGEKMKRRCTIGNYLIAFDQKTNTYSVFTKEEYAYGEGYRYPEYDGIETIAEAREKATSLL